MTKAISSNTYALRLAIRCNTGELAYEDAIIELDGTMTSNNFSDSQKQHCINCFEWCLEHAWIIPERAVDMIAKHIKTSYSKHIIPTPGWCVTNAQRLMWRMILASGCYDRIFVFGSCAVADALDTDVATPYRFVTRLTKMHLCECVEHGNSSGKANRYRFTPSIRTFIDSRTLAFWDEAIDNFPFLAATNRNYRENLSSYNR